MLISERIKITTELESAMAEDRSIILTPCIIVYSEVLDKIPRPQLYDFVLQQVVQHPRITEVRVTPIGVDGDDPFRNFDNIGLWCKQDNGERLARMIFTIEKGRFGKICLVSRE